MKNNYDVIRKKFSEIFKEQRCGETLKILTDIKIKETMYKKGHCFNQNERLEGVKFSSFKYLDLAVIIEGGTLVIKGFLPVN